MKNLMIIAVCLALVVSIVSAADENDEGNFIDTTHVSSLIQKDLD